MTHSKEAKSRKTKILEIPGNPGESEIHGNPGNKKKIRIQKKKEEKKEFRSSREFREIRPEIRENSGIDLSTQNSANCELRHFFDPNKPKWQFLPQQRFSLSEPKNHLFFEDSINELIPVTHHVTGNCDFQSIKNASLWRDVSENRPNKRRRGATTICQTAMFSVQMTSEAPNNKNPSAHADLSVGCGAGAARTWALRRCSPGARGALSVVTMKNLSWGQNYKLVLYGSKKRRNSRISSTRNLRKLENRHSGF